MNGAPLNKRRRPGPQPAAPTHEQLFREAYMAALGGCCTQFEVGLPYHKPQNAEGTQELQRARQLCLRAWNVAAYTVGLFGQEAEIEAFNGNVVKTHGGEDE
jgi:hypothetical protein